MAFFAFLVSYLIRDSLQLLSVNLSCPELNLNNQISDNMNMTYKIEGTNFTYLIIELKNVTNQQSLIALIFNENTPFNVQGNNLTYKTMDYDGFTLNKRNHFLQIKNSDLDKYITIITNNTITFDLILRGSSQPKCLNDCTVKGYCIDGVCKCGQNFIGRDCSIQAQLLKIDQPEPIKLKKQINYFYFEQLDRSKNLELIIQTKSNETIYLYETIQDKVYLPTPQINHFQAEINNSAQFSQKIKIKGFYDFDDDDEEILSNEEDEENQKENNTNIRARLILALTQFVESQQTEVQIILKYTNSHDSDFDVKDLVITICSVIFIIVLILICYFCSWKKKNDKKKELEKKLQIKTQFSEHQLEEKCSICLKQFNKSNFQQSKIVEIQQLCQAENKHIFHKDCIMGLLLNSKNPKCPNCRQQAQP